MGLLSNAETLYEQILFYKNIKDSVDRIYDLFSKDGKHNLKDRVEALHREIKKSLEHAHELASTELDYSIVNLAGLVQENIRKKYPLGKENRDMGVKAYDKDPLLLLHGYAQNRGALVDMADKMRREGFEFIFRMNYRYFRDIDKTIKMLDAKINDIIEKTRCTGKKVSIIGHSEGGLVARDYSFKHPENVNYCIMLGAPNKGTYLAILGYALALALEHSPITKLFGLEFDSASAYQMIPGVRKVPNINNNGVKFFSVYSRYDEAVIKKDSEILPFAVNMPIDTFGVKYRGHLALIHDSKIIDGIGDILNGRFDNLRKEKQQHKVYKLNTA